MSNQRRFSIAIKIFLKALSGVESRTHHMKAGEKRHHVSGVPQTIKTSIQSDANILRMAYRTMYLIGSIMYLIDVYINTLLELYGTLWEKHQGKKQMNHVRMHTIDSLE